MLLCNSSVHVYTYSTFKRSQISPCTPPQIWYNYTSYTRPSPPPLCLSIGPIVCIAILSHDVKVYLSPYQITVEVFVLIHLHNFEWCTLTRIHNIVYFLIARSHTHTQNRVILVVHPTPRLPSGNQTRLCVWSPSLPLHSLSPSPSPSPSFPSYFFPFVSALTIGHRAFTYLYIGL